MATTWKSVMRPWCPSAHSLARRPLERFGHRLAVPFLRRPYVQREQYRRRGVVGVDGALNFRAFAHAGSGGDPGDGHVLVGSTGVVLAMAAMVGGDNHQRRGADCRAVERAN